MSVNLFGRLAIKYLMLFGIYSAFWAAVILGAVNFWADPGWVLIPVMVLIFATFPLVMILSSVTEEGEGEPASVDKIRALLMAANEFDVPVSVTQKGRNTYIFSWRYADAKWYGILSKSGMQKTSELHVKLNEQAHTAKVVSVMKSVRWGVGATGIRLSGSYFRGAIQSYERGAAWGIDETFGQSKLYDYTFSLGELSNPVINSLLRNGWNVKFTGY